jgi:riboflavin biosynthesis pyrimidine reductase
VTAVSRLLIPEGRDLPDRAAYEEVYLPPAGPHLRLNFVSSVDGAIEVDGTSGGLGGEADKDAFMAMRAVADVILAGAATVRAENYGPAKLDAAARRRRVERGQAPLPPVAVVSASAGLAPDARLFAEVTDGPRPIVITTERAPVAELEAVADVVACGETTVDVAKAVAALAERGLRRILCEGGAQLSAHLMAAGLVDELCLTFAPQLAGAGRRALSGIWSGAPAALRLESLIEGGGMLLARYGMAR